MPRKLSTLLSVALLAAVPMIAHAQVGGRVGGAVGGTVGRTAGVGGAQAGVNGSAGIDDRAHVNTRRAQADATAAGRADTRAGARVNAPAAGASVGAQTSGGVSTSTRADGSVR